MVFTKKVVEILNVGNLVKIESWKMTTCCGIIIPTCV